MTPEQRRQYETDYAASLARAQHGLVLAAEYKLSPAQSETVGRIQSFMKLAENVHDRDPATAAQLAHRAGLLAEDLLMTLR
jgi:2,4-dienoyl-CoA reductase-like NADH-dependent reductase (Old Yellow Enzyme family)